MYIYINIYFDGRERTDTKKNKSFLTKHLSYPGSPTLKSFIPFPFLMTHLQKLL